VESSLDYVEGIATANSPAGTIHVALVGGPHPEGLCVSARSPDGELFMLKRSPDISYASDRLPGTCT